MRNGELVGQSGSRIELPVASGGVRPTSDQGRWAMARDDEREESYKILVVDVDDLCLKALYLELDTAGYEVWPAVDGREALAYIRSHGLPHVAILEYSLPGIDGLELASKLLKICDVPVMVMSARSDTRTVLKVFDTRAEDFVAKPLDYPIILARLKRLLRRVGGYSHAVRSRLRIDDWLEIDLSRRLARVDGKSIRLSSAENKLLHLLLRDAGSTLSPRYINQRLWPQADAFDDGALRSLVYRLRIKIERDLRKPMYVETQRELGYRFGGWVQPAEGCGKSLPSHDVKASDAAC